MQEATTAFKIRAVVEGSLPESLHKIPIEKRFTKQYVREVRRIAALLGACNLDYNCWRRMHPHTGCDPWVPPSLVHLYSSI